MWKNYQIEDDVKSAGVSEHTGFPNAGTDSSLTSLDLAKLLIQNPSSTFFMRIRGGSWEGRGVFDGDVIVIDRAVAPRRTDIVVFWHEDNFALEFTKFVPEGVAVWGVVTTVIHQYRSRL